MKKVFAILTTAVLLVAAVALTSSCKKDVANAKSLVGTTWTAKVDGTTISLTFPTSATFEMAGTVESLTVKAVGTFVLTGEKPSLTGSAITMTIVELPSVWNDVFEKSITGTFKSNTQLDLTDGDGATLTFTKQ